MSKDIEISGYLIPAADWSSTPASVKALVEHQAAKISELEAQFEQLSEQLRPLAERISELEEHRSKNSQNSLKPPSSEGFGKSVRPKQKKKGRGRGGQPGHPGHGRDLYSIERVDQVIEHYPHQCKGCGERLSGADSSPYRHQIVELPPIVPVVREHRLHQLSCEHCGSVTRAQLPKAIASGYGPRLSGVIGLLSSHYRLSHQRVVCLVNELFDIRLSASSINRLRRELNTALALPVGAAHGYVQAATVKHSDETGFEQGNSDGHNPTNKKGWLWVIVTPLVSYFEVFLSRSQASAEALLGQAPTGVIVSDRCGSYSWIPLEQRQVCWAHLKRDFTAMAERSGASGEIGTALLRRERRLFRLWHKVRDGTLTRAKFSQAIVLLRRGLKRELVVAAGLVDPKGKKSPLAKTVRTCQKLLQVEKALWTFVDVPGVEPTNNAAERALRPAVIWRRTSFGSQSLAGSQFVARMMTVITSLKAQQRPILPFLTQTFQAARLGQSAPSLLPKHDNEVLLPILS
ncbi:MAG: IS66 family transposase [Cyanobacteria bacterium J06581_3]